MAFGKNFLAGFAALSLAASPAFAKSAPVPSAVDSRASTQVADSEDGFGGSGLLIVLLILAAAAAAIILADSPDSP